MVEKGASSHCNHHREVHARPPGTGSSYPERGREREAAEKEHKKEGKVYYRYVTPGHEKGDRVPPTPENSGEKKEGGPMVSQAWGEK